MTIVTSPMPSVQLAEGTSSEAFAGHPGYQRIFKSEQLTVGTFLPLRLYQGDMAVLEGQTELVSEIDRRGFAAVCCAMFRSSIQVSVMPGSYLIHLPILPIWLPKRSALR